MTKVAPRRHVHFLGFALGSHRELNLRVLGMRHRKQTRKSREALPKAHNATRIPVKAQAQLVAVKAQAQLLVVKAQAQLLVVKAQAHLVAVRQQRFRNHHRAQKVGGGSLRCRFCRSRRHHGRKSSKKVMRSPAWITLTTRLLH